MVDVSVDVSNPLGIYAAVVGDGGSPGGDFGLEASSAGSRSAIAYIDPRIFIREGVARSLEWAAGAPVCCFSRFADWQRSAERGTFGVILVCIQGGSPADAVKASGLEEFVAAAGGTPIAVLSDSDSAEHVFDALNRGARGFIPTSSPTEVVVQALRLVMAGGLYAPAATLMAARAAAPTQKSRAPSGQDVFTSRQAAVVEALRRGKSNKIIAYELNMCESTVKVHVRNVMKKLKARNRTEVAFIANSMLAAGGLAVHE